MILLEKRTKTLLFTLEKRTKPPIFALENGQMIPQALVFCNENVSIDNNVYYIPIYMVCFLKKETLRDIKYTVDIKGVRPPE